MKIQYIKNNGQHFLCLPRALVKAKQWKKGDNIEFSINDKGDLVLTKGRDKHEN